jgi:hypothetical protein
MPAVAKTQTTTVRIPRPLYEEARDLVNQKKVKAPSMNEFIVLAMASFLKSYKRRQIDAAFAEMARDADYQKEAALISEQFEHSDWEALAITEQDVEEAEHELAVTR